MAIGRLYYYTLSILALGFCCITNYHMWPEKGYLPHQNIGNKFRKDPEEIKKEEKREAKKKAERKQEKKQRKQKRRESAERHEARREERRRRRGDYSDEPEWIADFSQKHHDRHNHGEHIHLSTPAPAAKSGRGRRVSFDDEQEPDLTTQRSGDVSNRYVPYDYHYGQGAVRTNGGTRPRGVRSPPGYGQYDGSPESATSNGKHSVGSQPTTSDRSKHATVQSNSDTVSPVPYKGGIATPGSRPFSMDVGPI
jgi:hypothetical protein